MSSTRWLSAVVTVLSLAAFGCARQPSPIERLGLEHPIWTRDGLYLVEQKEPGALFLTPAPLRLEAYDSVVVDEIQLEFKEGGPEFNDLEHRQAVAMVRRNILRRLSTLGLQQVEESGPDTLQLRIAITRIDYEPRFIREASSLLLTGSGGATITLEFRDGVDGRRLLVFAQNRQLPFGLYLGPQHVGAERIADTFYAYSRDLLRHLREANRGELPGPKTQAKVSLEPE
jgi:hypothetical protein